MPRIYLGLGSNLGDRNRYIDKALQLSEARIGRLVSRSACYATAPVGFDSDHCFLNAAACFETTLSPESLLSVTREIERQLGRTRKSDEGGGYTDRTIDIDLLVYEGVCLDTPSLTLPHPRLGERRFVLHPLCEIAPGLICPTTGQTMRQLYDTLNAAEVTPLTIEGCDELTATAIGRLLAQLTDKATPRITPDELRRLIARPEFALYLLRDSRNTVCGMASLLCHTQLTGRKGWLEDVVVDAECRGLGYGEQLVRHVITAARQQGTESISLTSRPDREAANRLYRRCGFTLRETNCYRLKL